MKKELNKHQEVVYSMISGLLKSKFFQDEPIPVKVDSDVKMIIETNKAYHFIPKVLIIDDNDNSKMSKFNALLKELTETMDTTQL